MHSAITTLGNFRLDDGYEIDYDYEILPLKISNCKSENVQFFDTIYLANGSWSKKITNTGLKEKIKEIKIS